MRTATLALVGAGLDAAGKLQGLRETYRIARNLEKTFVLVGVNCIPAWNFPMSLFFYRRETSGVTRISSRTSARIGRLKTEI